MIMKNIGKVSLFLFIPWDPTFEWDPTSMN